MENVLRFLEALQQNNNKAWFDENRSFYEESRQEFVHFVKDLIPRLAEIEPFVGQLEPKNCTYRIYRDVRFSKNKTPYKINMSAYFADGGKKSDLPGYYLHIQPGGNSFLAGGMYEPSPEQLKSIRQEIDYNADQLRAIFATPGFKKYYPTLLGDKLKSTPRDYDASHPDIEWLKHKSFFVSHPLQDKEVTSPAFMEKVLTVWKELKPFNDYFRMAATHDFD
jgi:uncharacterized protein (TIGR02453 family)